MHGDARNAATWQPVSPADIDAFKQLAAALGIAALALVSVYGTDEFWGRWGFREVCVSELNAKLSSYGTSAKYMVCALPI